MRKADISKSRVVDDLQAIKVPHAVIWAALAACVLAIPVLGWAEMYRQDDTSRPLSLN